MRQPEADQEVAAKLGDLLGTDPERVILGSLRAELPPSSEEVTVRWEGIATFRGSDADEVIRLLRRLAS